MELVNKIIISIITYHINYSYINENVLIIMVISRYIRFSLPTAYLKRMQGTVQKTQIKFVLPTRKINQAQAAVEKKK